MQKITAVATEEARLDLLAAQASGASRSQAARWIEQGLCQVNGMARKKPAFKVSAGDALELTVPDAEETPVEKEDIPLEILYEDADLAVVVKPCGMVVHPAAGNESGTLVNALLYHMEDLSGIGGVKRPGIVHRLDKDTSGLLMVAKNDLAHQGLSDQLRARTMEKHYLAVVDGRMREPSGRVDKPIARSTKDRKRMAVDPAGREAVTEWTLLENLKNAALLDVHILTGRTHQIRVHMQSLHHPVAGDPIYGQKNGVKAPRLMLHAYTLSFTHPRTGERLSFTAPPPGCPQTAPAPCRRCGSAAAPPASPAPPCAPPATRMPATWSRRPAQARPAALRSSVSSGPPYSSCFCTTLTICASISPISGRLWRARSCRIITRMAPRMVKPTAMPTPRATPLKKLVQNRRLRSST